MLLLLKFICSCTCTRTITGQQQLKTVSAATTTTTQSNLHKLLKRAHMSYTTGKCEHFIWKAHSPVYILSDLGGISYVSVHFTWQVDLVVHFIWKWPYSALCHKMSLPGGYIWSHCALHLTSCPSWTLNLKTWPNSVTVSNGLSLKT